MDSMVNELLEKFEKKLGSPVGWIEGLYLMGDKDGVVITNQDDCEKLKSLGFNEDVRYVFYGDICYRQGEKLDWNKDDDEMFSCPTYKQAIAWLKKRL